VLNVGQNTSRGVGGAGTFSRPDLAALTFPFGTGVSQGRVDAVGHTEASLRIDFNVTYDVIAGFGPPTYSFANLPLGGVVSDDGFVRFTYQATFVGNPGAGILGGTLGGTYFNDTPGAFVVPLFEFNTNNNGIAGDGTIVLNGFIEFEAYDNTEAGGMHLTLSSRPKAASYPPRCHHQC
jgi:hypothetical protein